MKLEIHSEWDWGAGYLFLWIDDHNLWCSFIIRNDNSIEVLDHSNIDNKRWKYNKLR